MDWSVPRARKPLVLAPLAACITLFSSLADAVVAKAETSISNIRIEVADLNPDDGIDAGYEYANGPAEWAPAGGSRTLLTVGSNWFGPDVISLEAPTSGYLEAMAHQFSVTGRHARAGVLAAGGLAASASVERYGYVGAVASTHTLRSSLVERLLQLTPYTQVSVSFEAAVHAFAPPDAEATAIANGSLTVGGGYGTRTSIAAIIRSDDENRSFEQAQSFTLTTSNTTGNYLPLYLLFNASGSVFVPAIPEPSSWALLLIGIGVLGMRLHAKRGTVARVRHLGACPAPAA